MDRIAGTTTNWKIVWGSIKSVAKNERVQGNIDAVSNAIATRALQNPIAANLPALQLGAQPRAASMISKY
jgi:hypothetical protein